MKNKIAKAILLSCLLTLPLGMLGGCGKEDETKTSTNKDQIETSIEASDKSTEEQAENLSKTDSTKVESPETKSSETLGQTSGKNNTSTSKASDSSKASFDDSRENEVENELKPISEYTNFVDLINDRIDDDPYVTYEGITTLYCGPSIAYVDVNADGRKDLIVAGALGLRSKMFTDVILDLPDGYEAIPFDGEPIEIRGNKLLFGDPDYAQAGAITYEDDYIVEFDKDGKSHEILSHYTEECWIDEETGEYADEPTYVIESYSIGKEVLTQEQYDEILKAYEKEAKEKIEYVNLSDPGWESIFN